MIPELIEMTREPPAAFYHPEALNYKPVWLVRIPLPKYKIRWKFLKMEPGDVVSFMIADHLVVRRAINRLTDIMRTHPGKLFEHKIVYSGGKYRYKMLIKRTPLVITKVK